VFNQGFKKSSFIFISLNLAIFFVLFLKNEVTTQINQKFITKESIQENPVKNTQVLGAKTKVDKTQFALKLYNLINGYRKENNLGNLKISPLLERSATEKLQDMITNQYWQHYNKDQLGPWYFFTKAEYNFALAGENMAFSATSPWQVFTDWQNSASHNQQLLTSEYKDMGLSIDCESYSEYYQTGCLVVLHLGKLK